MNEAKLTATEGPLKGKEFILDKTVIIGRLPENDITIEDGTASRQHTQIELRNEEFIVTDLNSQNGTFVNRSKIKEAVLKHGDTITIGDSEFRFEQEVEEEEDATVISVVEKPGESAMEQEDDHTVVGEEADKTVFFRREKKEDQTEQEEQEESDKTVMFRAKPEKKKQSFDPEEFLREKILEKPKMLAALGIMGFLMVVYLFIPQGATKQGRAKAGKSTQRAETPRLTVDDILDQIQDPETLKQKAQEALSVAKSFYSQRQVKYDNLIRAIAKFEEALRFMEGLEPKPDIYEEVAASLEEAKKTLDKEIQDRMFRSQQAMRMRDWDTAAREAKALMETIGDRNDPRYEVAEAKYRDALYRMRR